MDIRIGNGYDVHALGDIGHLFPDTSPEWKGVDKA